MPLLNGGGSRSDPRISSLQSGIAKKKKRRLHHGDLTVIAARPELAPRPSRAGVCPDGRVAFACC